jgi:hypothetical protein
VRAGAEAAAVTIACATAGVWRARIVVRRGEMAEAKATVERSGELRRASRGAKCLHAARMMWTASVITLGVSVFTGRMVWHGSAGAGLVAALNTVSNVASAGGAVLAAWVVMRGAEARERLRKCVECVEIAEGLERLAARRGVSREDAWKAEATERPVG